jgi:hypothetical protein
MVLPSNASFSVAAMWRARFGKLGMANRWKHQSML